MTKEPPDFFKHPGAHDRAGSFSTRDFYPGGVSGSGVVLLGGSALNVVGDNGDELGRRWRDFKRIPRHADEQRSVDAPRPLHNGADVALHRRPVATSR